MSAHTPGPWVVENHRIVGERSRHSVAFIGNAGNNEDTATANERLIAAAPDLLQALDDLLLCIEVDALIPESVSFMRQARAAILKATGAESKESA